jgi:uncharacterized protein with von Willebrand factor type A (vWA) domain
MTMNFAGAGARVRQLLAPAKPADLQKSALTSDPLRDHIIEEAEQDSERFRHALEKRPQVEYERTHEDGSTTKETYDWHTFDEVQRDFARAAFGWEEPECTDRSKIRPSHRLNREILQSALHSTGFHELRPYSRNNEGESLCGAIVGGESLCDIAQERLGEHIARSEQMSEQEQRQQSADEMFEQLRGRARQEIDENGAVAPDTRRQIKQALKQGQAAQDALGELMQAEAGSSMMVDAIAAGRELANSAQEGVEMLSSLPGFEPGNAHNLPLDKQIELAEKWSQTQDLKAVLKMLGRMLRSMTFKRKARVKNVDIEPVGVTTGDTLRLLLPHEMARGFSDHPLIKATFMKDFAERSLLQYDMQGKEPAGKGPVITVHDGSGSMSGTKFVWATSVCLATLTIAHKEHRHFAGVEFGSHGQIKSWQFPARKPVDPELALDYATHFFAGGTSTVGGMAEALRIMRAQEEFRSADVLLIGDGCDHFGDEDRRVRDELRALGARIHGITILTPSNPYFAQMCEWHTDVQDLSGANEATDRLAQNIT